MWDEKQGMELAWVTYAQLAALLGIKPASARRTAARRGWPRKRHPNSFVQVQLPADLAPFAPCRTEVQACAPLDTFAGLERELSAIASQWMNEAARIEDLWRRRARFEAQQVLLYAEWEREQIARSQGERSAKRETELADQAIQRCRRERAAKLARDVERRALEARVRTPPPKRIRTRAA
jgi:hypothetical protein